MTLSLVEATVASLLATKLDRDLRHFLRLLILQIHEAPALDAIISEDESSTKVLVTSFHDLRPDSVLFLFVNDDQSSNFWTIGMPRCTESTLLESECQLRRRTARLVEWICHLTLLYDGASSR